MDELKLRIKKSGITQKELADKMGINYNRLNRYLNKFDVMPDYVLEDIEKVLSEIEDV